MFYKQHPATWNRGFDLLVFGLEMPFESAGPPVQALHAWWLSLILQQKPGLVQASGNHLGPLLTSGVECQGPPLLHMGLICPALSLSPFPRLEMPDLRPLARLLFSGLGEAGDYNSDSSDFRLWKYLRPWVVSGDKCTLSISCSWVGLLAPLPRFSGKQGMELQAC